MIKLSKAVIVEGKYDKIRLANLLDATIITTDGFRVFKDKEKCGLIKTLAEKCGIVILTDSDNAGQIIRKYLEKIVPKEQVVSVYLPQILGKEKRKTVSSAQGLLGVEGTDDNIILTALGRAGVIGEPVTKLGRKITKTDLFNIGVSGGQGSKEKRNQLLKFLNLPAALPTNSLLDVLNCLYGYDDFIYEVEKWKQE
ncbi:MAG: DUF4093 domain-containing protein [Clostridia bacterium]|nr:DUF4093 domain-containing protein [Clostridia bacterium]